jgi:hypothetical protein
MNSLKLQVSEPNLASHTEITDRIRASNNSNVVQLLDGDRVLGAHQVSVGSQTADLSLLPNRRDVLSAVR